MSIFEFLSLLRPFNTEEKGVVFVTFLQFGFEDIWFNVLEEDFDNLRFNSGVGIGWTNNADQAIMGNSTRDNF